MFLTSKYNERFNNKSKMKRVLYWTETEKSKLSQVMKPMSLKNEASQEEEKSGLHLEGLNKRTLITLVLSDWTLLEIPKSMKMKPHKNKKKK